MASIVIFTPNATRLAVFYGAVLTGTLDQPFDRHLSVTSKEEAVTFVEYVDSESVETDAPSRDFDRTEAAVKPVFRVTNLKEALAKVLANGGRDTGRYFDDAGVRCHDVVDCDGNVIQLQGLWEE